MDALKRILYMFVCEEENLDEAYIGDTFMEEVIDVAKAIADKRKFHYICLKVRLENLIEKKQLMRVLVLVWKENKLK